jgi:hypothetical protein
VNVRTIPSSVVDKVAQILPRLGSDHPGEVVATAAAVVRVLGKAGHDLYDLVGLIRQGAIALPPPKEPPPDPSFDFEFSAAWCREHQYDPRLSARDRGFLRSMGQWFERRKMPTEKQAAWLSSIGGGSKTNERSRIFDC